MLTEGLNSWKQVFLCMIRVHHKNIASTGYCRRFFYEKFYKRRIILKERTVNGMPIREVWEKLQAEFPSDAVKKHPSTGMAYIPVEKIEERLNNVVGMGNWDFELIAPVQVYSFGSDGFESCIASGKLSIYDDERVPIVRSTSGAADVIYPKNQHVQHLLQIRLTLQCRMFLNDVQKGSGLA